MTIRSLLAATFLSLLLAACAGTPGYEPPEERMADRLALFERHAGAPVDQLQFFRMQRFEVLGDYHVALWTGVNEAWLIEVMKPCIGLEFADGVGITSTNRYVYQRFDSVVFEDQRCRIAEIRPVDAEALKREQRENPDV